MRGSTFTLVVCLALITASTASASETGARAEVKVVSPSPVFPLSNEQIFSDFAQQPMIQRDHGMQIVDNPKADVMIARINSDGTISTLCVETADAARLFFTPRQQREAAGTVEQQQ